jgi:hypothetical protein
MAWQAPIPQLTPNRPPRSPIHNYCQYLSQPRHELQWQYT